MKKIFLLLPVLAVSFLSAGCYDVDSNFKSIRNETLAAYEKNFITDTEFSLGSFELWMAEGIIGIVQSDEMAEEIMDALSGVQIGVYKNSGEADIHGSSMIRKIDAKMKKQGWQFIVKSFDNEELTAVYINRDKLLKELFVISVNQEEITIVQASGDLERVIETAIKEHGLKFNKDERERLAKN